MPDELKLYILNNNSISTLPDKWENNLQSFGCNNCPKLSNFTLLKTDKVQLFNCHKIFCNAINATNIRLNRYTVGSLYAPNAKKIYQRKSRIDFRLEIEHFTNLVMNSKTQPDVTYGKNHKPIIKYIDEDEPDKFEMQDFDEDESDSNNNL